MTPATRQLALDLGHRPSLTGADFLVSPANEDAVRWIDRWPDWPGPVLAIAGPGGAGKTHLAHVFMARSGAALLAPGDLAERTPAELVEAHPALVIDDADALAGEPGERSLLHLVNLLREGGGHMLLTGAAAPARWRVALPDLRSRLNAVTAVTIGAPDDPLIAAVLVKLFADRQLRVDADVVDYLVARMERSFAAARAVVAALDARALAERRNITVPLARRVLDEIPAAAGEDDESEGRMTP